MRTEARTHSALKGVGKSSTIVTGAWTNSPTGRHTNGKQFIFSQSVTSSFMPCLKHLGLSPTATSSMCDVFSKSIESPEYLTTHSPVGVPDRATELKNTSNSFQLMELFNIRLREVKRWIKAASLPSFFNTQLQGSTQRHTSQTNSHGNRLFEQGASAAWTC